MQDVNQPASKGLASTIAGLGTTTTTSTTEITGLTDLTSKLTGAVNNLKASFQDVIDKVSLFDDKLVQTSKGLGQGVTYATDLKNRFSDVAQNIIRIGGNVDDVIVQFQSMTKALDRTVYLSNETLFNARLLKETGVDDTTINSFNKLFDTIGGTFQEATVQQMQLVNQAKSYGLNVSSFMTTVAGQLTKINQYGFPNGVKDISEMVVKSKMLGMNMEGAAKMADNLMGSPEAALDLAAKMQTLGGSFSSLADPMELLYLAQNDLAGLNDKLINATRGLAVFNKETGQFEVSVQDRLRIKQIATDFGMNASEIIDMSTKLAKQEEIVSRLNFTPNFQGMGEEEKRVIAQYAQISKGGEITLEGSKLSSLQTTEIDSILKRLQGAGSQLVTEGAGMTEKNMDVIQQNMSTLERVNTGLNVYENSVTLMGIKNDEVNKILDNLGTSLGGLATNVGTVKTEIAETLKRVVTSAAPTGIDTISSAFSGITSVIGSIPQKITVESVNPIKIELTGSADLQTVIKDALGNYFKNKINTATGASTDGASNPY